MMATVGLGWEQVRKMNLAMLTRMADRVTFDRWTHTANLCWVMDLARITNINMNITKKSDKLKPATLESFHPYMQEENANSGGKFTMKINSAESIVALAQLMAADF